MTALPIPSSTRALFTDPPLHGPSHSTSSTSAMTSQPSLPPSFPPPSTSSSPHNPLSFNNKRVTADRLDKLDRIFTAGAEGKPGVKTQIGFENTQHATLYQYSTSLPSAPSPPPSLPSIALPLQSPLPSTLSPQSASADGVRFFPSSHHFKPSFLRLEEEKQQIPAFPAFTTAVDESSLHPPRPSSSHASTSRPALPVFPSFLPSPDVPPIPSPTSAAVPPLSSTPVDASDHAEGEAVPPPKQLNTLLHYWTASTAASSSSSSKPPASRGDDDTSQDGVEIIDTEPEKRSKPTGKVTGNKRKAPQNSGKDEVKLKEQLEKKEAELAEAQSRLAQSESQFKISAQAAHLARESLKEQLASSDHMRQAVLKALVTSLREAAALRRAETDRQMVMEQHEVGRMIPLRDGISLTDMWVESENYKQLRVRCEQLKEDVKELMDDSAKMKRKLARQKSVIPPPPSDDNGGFARPAPIDLVKEDDILTVRLSELRTELADIERSISSMQLRKQSIIRWQKLSEHQLNSRFRPGDLLHDGRYLILEMLGKGGFSEVFKAYDTQLLCEVAMKIHQLNPSWNDERKANYIKHAEREYNIHRGLEHRSVVKLLDVFGLSKEEAGGGEGKGDYGFVTVLEYCNGNDLDFHLKCRGVLNEREARVIIRQLFSALLYFSQHSPRRIIHYDLKPGNILFHDHSVKITDFGLSKILSEGDDCHTSMELTSQGAGTYWYLPPECFPSDHSSSPTLPFSHPPPPPLISSKVDIFSAGVILFQMLAGKKPFGHGQTPAMLHHDSVMKNADPNRIQWESYGFSEVTKEFLKKCLGRRAEDRPDIGKIFEDPFFSATFKEGEGGGKRKREEEVGKGRVEGKGKDVGGRKKQGM